MRTAFLTGARAVAAAAVLAASLATPVVVPAVSAGAAAHHAAASVRVPGIATSPSSCSPGTAS